ncbi:MAG: putative toxin-antitoxin system toxin component, PIN family [Spirochaetota bacterium]
MTGTVFDSNIYISAILFGGRPRRLLDLAIRGKLRVFISPAIVSEIEEVLTGKKFGFAPEVVRSVIEEIGNITTMVVPEKRHSVVSRDSDDNIIIDCAVQAGAEYIVTGDNDLLALGSFGRVAIVGPLDFLSIVKGDEG